MIKLSIYFFLIAAILNLLSANESNFDESIADDSDIYLDQCTNDRCDQKSINRENCDLHRAIESFRQKRLTRIDTSIASLDDDPYSNYQDISTDQDRIQLEIMRNLVDDQRINCGLRYLDGEKIDYRLKTFKNEQETTKFGYHLTHYGRCGSCSSLQDLNVYLIFQTNLTVLARQCAFFTFISDRLTSYCYGRLGFTESCSRIWMYNSKNTRRWCWWTCLKSWFTNESFNSIEDQNRKMAEPILNSCLQCDEDHSGLIFKYHAGRTRLNSGIVTAIGRPKDEIRNVTHCYY